MNLHSAINPMHFRFSSSKKSITDALSIVISDPSNSAIANYMYIYMIHLVQKKFKISKNTFFQQINSIEETDRKR